ncbi:KR domain protein [Leptospira fainei serovar Hurstbridge str. BUT 6]|uniref:KR domain protein n=1 Tax=Leptospira fainei serovar Hurstbridge str. BUT 6 TaxID=1193011 RepID=S3V2Q6_9LEPT|nr:SDR family NAD(P)-dependent oxidoreductase [Leptospira fainei]EPG75713.1 KR domain protein [Leptospira fainei serovar Hurstbridge str. BUT 6]
MNQTPFEGKKVFIAGGSAGIGKGLAMSFAKKGASVMIAARGESALLETVAELKKAANSSAIFGHVAVDVSDSAQVRIAAKKVLDTLGGLDLLICNSGYAQAGTVENLDETTFRTLMDVNYFGHVNLAKAFQAHFAAQHSGDIIFVSSMLAILSVYGYSAYSASKFAIVGFSQAFRQEMLLHNVRVKLFLPPTTDTPGLLKENEDKPLLCKEIEMGSALNATHSVETVVKAFIDWLPSRKFFGYATWDSWLQYFLARHFPELTLKIADGELRSAQLRLLKKNNRT